MEGSTAWNDWFWMRRREDFPLLQTPGIYKALIRFDTKTDACKNCPKSSGWEISKNFNSEMFLSWPANQVRKDWKRCQTRSHKQKKKWTALQRPAITYKGHCSWNHHSIIQVSSFPSNQQKRYTKQAPGQRWWIHRVWIYRKNVLLNNLLESKYGDAFIIASYIKWFE